MVLLTAEVMELKANPNRRARGLVSEAELDKGKRTGCNRSCTEGVHSVSEIRSQQVLHMVKYVP